MAKGKNRIIVLIDDHEIQKDLLKRKFEATGATVYAAAHLERAIGLIEGLVREHTLPDLIVSEIKLPGCYGLSGLRSLHQALQGCSVPFVVVSSGFSSLALDHMKLYNTVAYVEKPVLTDKLFDFIEGVFKEIQAA